MNRIPAGSVQDGAWGRCRRGRCRRGRCQHFPWSIFLEGGREAGDIAALECEDWVVNVDGTNLVRMWE
jgi:hypothetical protein